MLGCGRSERCEGAGEAGWLYLIFIKYLFDIVNEIFSLIRWLTLLDDWVFLNTAVNIANPITGLCK